MPDRDEPEKPENKESQDDQESQFSWTERRKSFGVRDTAILSRNNSGLRRFLNQHSDDNDTTESAESTSDTAPLSARQEVLLVIRGVVERLLMTDDSVYRLGRYDIGTKRFDEIDLSPYGALDRGVSRVHAQLHFEDDKLFVTDLGSTNGTYLRGERLEPRKSVELRKGDELLLGRLTIQVLFR